MNPPTTTNRDPAEYLASVLRLNPMFQADEILAARDRFLGRSEPVAAPSGWELQEQRDVLQTQIDSLRQRFWSTPPNELLETLESLQADQFPDLQMAAERLQAAFRCRSQFFPIAQHDTCDSELFDVLKQIAVAAPRDAGRTKQEFFLRISTNRKLHSSCRKMIETLRHDFSEVYQLESEWLCQIEQVKPFVGQSLTEKESAKRAAAAQRARTEGSSGHAGWAVIGFVFLGLVRACLNSDSHSPPPPQNPSVSQQRATQAELQRWLLQHNQNARADAELAPGGKADESNDHSQKTRLRTQDIVEKILERRRKRALSAVPDQPEPSDTGPLVE